MEKRTPHYLLDNIKAAVSLRGVSALTRSSIDGGAAMGLTVAQVMAVVMRVEAGMFYKSMTTHSDHRVWQDVYHSPTPAGFAYVKFTLRERGTIVISFKHL